jgi:hypothetical protein
MFPRWILELVILLKTRLSKLAEREYILVRGFEACFDHFGVANLRDQSQSPFSTRYKMTLFSTFWTRTRTRTRTRLPDLLALIQATPCSLEHEQSSVYIVLILIYINKN